MRTRRTIFAIAGASAAVVASCFIVVHAGQFLSAGRHPELMANGWKAHYFDDWLPGGSHWANGPQYPARISFPKGGSGVPESDASGNVQPSLDDLDTRHSPLADIAETGADLNDGYADNTRQTFSDIFRDFAIAGKSADRNTAAATEKRRVTAPEGVVASTFNLRSRQANSGLIETSKTIYANGTEKGMISLRIVNDTTVMIDARKLANKFEDKQAQSQLSNLASTDADNSYVDFDTLRSVGFDIRYDPIRDIVIVQQNHS